MNSEDYNRGEDNLIDESPSMNHNSIVENLVIKPPNSKNKFLNLVDFKSVQYADTRNPRSMSGGCDFWTIAICVFGVFLVIGLLSQSEQFKNTFLGSSLSNDLVSKGWFLVSRSTCPFCVKQKNVVGNDYPNLIECDTGIGNQELLSQLCGSVNAYPTWINVSTGQKVEGFLTEEGIKQRLL